MCEDPKRFYLKGDQAIELNSIPAQKEDSRENLHESNQELIAQEHENVLFDFSKLIEG